MENIFPRNILTLYHTNDDKFWGLQNKVHSEQNEDSLGITRNIKNDHFNFFYCHSFPKPLIQQLPKGYK